MLDKAPKLYQNTERVFESLDKLAENPNTLLALRDLDTTLDVLTPLVEYVAPYQTVCNYFVYWTTGLSEHVSEIVPGGTGQRTNLKSDNRAQDNRLSDSQAERPVDIPAGQDPQTASLPSGAAPGAAQRRLQPGDRRPGQRRLPHRAARLPRRAARARTAATGRTRTAASTWCSRATRESSPAAPTWPAGSASTT